MEELFNKSILDQMYEFRKENFEQYVYDNNKEIKDIQFEISDLNEEFITFLENVIPNEQMFKDAVKKLQKYELKCSKEIELWSLEYFKLGMLEREKIRNEFFENQIRVKENETFINYESNNFSEWLELQKRKHTFGTKEYKELQKKYNEISKRYPNTIEVFEDLKPLKLNDEEMKALVELRKIDIDMGYMEKDLCFKLGMKEVISF